MVRQSAGDRCSDPCCLQQTPDLLDQCHTMQPTGVGLPLAATALVQARSQHLYCYTGHASRQARRASTEGMRKAVHLSG